MRHLNCTLSRIDKLAEDSLEFRVITSGVVSLLKQNSVEITELPIGVWSEVYKRNVLETHKNDSLILDFKEYNTESKLRFVIKLTPQQLMRGHKQGLHKYFKLHEIVSFFRESNVGFSIKQLTNNHKCYLI